jgi:eukaryotic-like serine/threonine-protein kinase
VRESPTSDDSHTLIEGSENAAPGFELTRGALLAGRYEIGRRLGRGGVGVVVQARDVALGEDVAIKVLRPEHSGEARRIERLAREVKLARQIRHPNVCRVFDFGQADGHAFLVMELARGSLRDEIVREAAAARPLAARLADARAVADGLAAVHAAGIVHRDVTPQNVLRMNDGRLVVSDFGLATLVDPTTNSIHGGTVAYMAPEIARGECATLASDVWALGVIIHEIVFGRRPTWRQGRFRPTMEPAAEASLGPTAQGIREICVHCTEVRGRRRPTAEQVSRLVARTAEDNHARTSRGRWWRAVPLAGAALLAVALAARPRRPAPATLAVPPSRALAFEGDAADWSRDARVLATLDGPIHGITALPGGERVRVAWGDPSRSEDVDLVTGARANAALPSLPARAGTPVPSPDGTQLACEGYDAGGHSFIFLGATTPGTRLAPVTAAADPSVSSEPRWLADGRAFVYDADPRNVGVFSLDTNRATILPAFDARPSFTTFKAVVHDRILVNRLTDDLTSQLAIFSWPEMTVAARFDVPGFAVEWRSDDETRLYGIVYERGRGSQVIGVDVDERRATRLGRVAGHVMHSLALVGRALVFATHEFGGDLWLETNGQGRLVTRNLGGREVARGGGRVLVAIRRDGLERIVEVDEDGHERSLTAGPVDESPSILPGGRAWTYVRHGGDAPGYYRCAFDGACARVLDLIMPYATVSPDGTLVAYIDPVPQGQRARLVPLAGGAPRDLGDGGSYCAPVWSSPRTLWISRRTEGAPTWVELDVATPDARPTGRTRPGTRACADGLPDPASPVRDGARIVVSAKSELRVHAVP